MTTKKGRGRPKKEVYYRLATITEIPSIVEFCKKIPKDNGIDSWAPSNTKLATESLLQGLKGDRGFIFLAVIQKSPYTKKTSGVKGNRSDTMVQEIVGVLVLAKGDLWWSDKDFYTNVVFYVEPLYRKRGVSENLLFLAKSFTSDLGIPFIVEILTEHKLPLFDRYFAMKGFKKIGARYALIPQSTP